MFSKILTLLVALVEAIKRRQRQQEQQQHESEMRDIEKDPAKWFDDHFNGDGHRMRDNTDDAAKASKADSAKLDNKP